MKKIKLFLILILTFFSLHTFSMEESQKKLNQKLFQAIQNRDLNQVEYYLQLGADINAKDCSGKTVLMWAILYQPEAVEYLIDYCKSNNEAMRFFHDYCQHDDDIELNVNAKDNNNKTAIIYALENNLEAIIYLLFDYCKSNNIKLDLNIKDKEIQAQLIEKLLVYNNNQLDEKIKSFFKL